MKKLLLLSFLIPFLCFSQEAEKTEQKKDESRLALFSAKTGALIKRVNIEVGKVGSTTVKTAVITNLLTNDTSKGIRIEKPSTKQYGSDAIAFIDEDEIAGLLKSIQLIKEEIAPTVPSDYTEVSFKSRSGFEAGCFVSKDKWSYYLKVDKYSSDSYHFLKESDLDKFESLVKEAQSKLTAL